MGPAQLLSAAAAACLLLACSPDPRALVDEGYTALNTGRSAEACAKFGRALERLGPEDVAYLDARLGRIAARTREHPEQAKEEFLAVAREFPDRIGEPQFLDMSAWLVSARRYEEALALIDGGLRVASGPRVRLAAQRELVSAEEKRNRPVQGKVITICVYGAPDKP